MIKRRKLLNDVVEPPNNINEIDKENLVEPVVPEEKIVTENLAPTEVPTLLNKENQENIPAAADNTKNESVLEDPVQNSPQGDFLTYQTGFQNVESSSELPTQEYAAMVEQISNETNFENSLNEQKPEELPPTLATPIENNLQKDALLPILSSEQEILNPGNFKQEDKIPPLYRTFEHTTENTPSQFAQPPSIPVQAPEIAKIDEIANNFIPMSEAAEVTTEKYRQQEYSSELPILDSTGTVEEANVIPDQPPPPADPTPSYESSTVQEEAPGFFSGFIDTMLGYLGLGKSSIEPVVEAPIASEVLGEVDSGKVTEKPSIPGELKYSILLNYNE